MGLVKTLFSMTVALLMVTMLVYYADVQRGLPSYKLAVSDSFKRGNTKPFIFIESSCVSKQDGTTKGGLKLNSRQACAIYSTAKMHPKREVYLYHSCPLSQDYFSRSSSGVKVLQKLKNLKIINTNVSDWLSGTPVESKMKDLMTSSHPVEHSSDLLRLALVWKIGATYLDLDVVTIKSLDKLGRNWMCAATNRDLANGVMDFDKGHGIPFLAMETLKTSYDPRGWSTNGPLLLTSTVRRNCPSARTVSWDQIDEIWECQARVLPNHVMFPYHWSRWKVFFTQPKSELAKARVYLTVGRSYTVHLYNYMSSKTLSDGAHSPYSVLAATYCPSVYKKDPKAF